MLWIRNGMVYLGRDKVCWGCPAFGIGETFFWFVSFGDLSCDRPCSIHPGHTCLFPTYTSLVRLRPGGGSRRSRLIQTFWWRCGVVAGCHKVLPRPHKAKSVMTFMCVFACLLLASCVPRQVYDLMREAGIRPNSRSLLELVNLCRANGLASVAARIMRQRSKMAATTSRRDANVSRRYASSSRRSSSNNNTERSGSGSKKSRSTSSRGKASTRKNAPGAGAESPSVRKPIDQRLVDQKAEQAN